MLAIVEDDPIVGRAKEGNEEAFEVLFKRYYGYAVRTALLYVKSSVDARDIAQDAFLRVHRNIGNFRQDAKFSTWLYRIVVNLSIDFIRKHRRMTVSDTEAVLEVAGRPDQEFWGVGGEPPAPDEVLEREDTVRSIGRALSQSSASHREVLILRELWGYSYDEIATSLGIQKGTVMSRLFHARRKLKRLLDVELRDEVRSSSDGVVAC